MRIAVTGAGGRIGGEVVRLVAADQQHQVVALSQQRWAAVSGEVHRLTGRPPEPAGTALVRG